MRCDGEESDGGPGDGRGDAGAAPLLRAVEDSGTRRAGPPDHVRLLREFKGPLVDDLLRDEQLAASLPGRVLRALDALERGDFAAAEKALPGELHAVLTGPRPWSARRRHLLLLLVALFGVLGLGLALAAV